MAQFSVYAHLTPTTHPDRICETVKLTVKPSAEEAKEAGDSVSDLATQVRDFLTQERNDGNKVYEVLALSSSFMGVPAPLAASASSLFSANSDVYVTVRVTVDAKRHVAPISVTPVAQPAPQQAAASVPAQ